MTILAWTSAVSFGAIVLIWFGYPVAVWAAARLWGDPIKPVHHRVSPRVVSVVVATRDSASAIHARIANLRDTEHPLHQLQIVVALDAGGSATTVDELTAADDRVRVVLGDLPGGKAAALNAGVRAARGDVIVLADTGQRFDRRTIPELVAALEDSRFGAVSGALTLGGSQASPVARYWAMEKWLRYNEAILHSAIGVTGAVYATRRSLWPAVPAGALLDDVYVPMALTLAGHRIGFVPGARAFDVREFTAKAEGARKTRTLTGVMQLRQLLPGLMSPSHNPVWLQFVAHKWLRLATPLFAVAFAISALLLAGLLLVRATPGVRVTALAALVLPLAIPRVRRVVLGLLHWVVAMQVATARATVNGMRARWQVWSRTN